MGAFQIQGDQFVETYSDLLEAWHKLDAIQKKLSTSLNSAQMPPECTVMGGVDYARRNSGDDASGVSSKVTDAHYELSKFLFAARAAFDEYQKTQDDGAMRFAMMHPDEAEAKYGHAQSHPEAINPTANKPHVDVDGSVEHVDAQDASAASGEKRAMKAGSF